MDAEPPDDAGVQAAEAVDGSAAATGRSPAPADRQRWTARRSAAAPRSGSPARRGSCRPASAASRCSRRRIPATSSASAATIETRRPASAGSRACTRGSCQRQRVHAQRSSRAAFSTTSPRRRLSRYFSPPWTAARTVQTAPAQQQMSCPLADGFVDHAPLQLERQRRQRDHQHGKQDSSSWSRPVSSPDEPVEPAGQRLLRLNGLNQRRPIYPT